MILTMQDVLWVRNAHEAVLFDPARGQAHALIWHDGYGAYYPTVFIGPLAYLWRRFFLQALGTRHHDRRAWPRLTVRLVPVNGSMDAAIAATEVYLFGFAWMPVDHKEVP